MTTRWHEAVLRHLVGANSQKPAFKSWHSLPLYVDHVGVHHLYVWIMLAFTLLNCLTLPAAVAVPSSMSLSNPKPRWPTFRNWPRPVSQQSALATGTEHIHNRNG